MVVLPFLLPFSLRLCFLHSCSFPVGSTVSFPFSVLHVVYPGLHLPPGLASCGLCRCRRPLCFPSAASLAPAPCSLCLHGPLVLSCPCHWDATTSLPSTAPLLLLHSAFLNDTGLSMMGSLGFLTPDEHGVVVEGPWESGMSTAGERETILSPVT